MRGASITWRSRERRSRGRRSGDDCREQLEGTLTETTTVSLEDDLRRFVDRQIAEGRYQNRSEVISAGLKLLEEREAKLLQLREALIEGEASGSPGAFDFEAFLREKRARHPG